MEKKVILINPPMSPLEEDLYIPLHYLSLGAVARQLGWDVEIIDFDLIFKIRKLEPNLDFIVTHLSEIKTEKTTVFGLTAYGHNIWLSCEMGKKLKELYPKATLVMGGPEATFSAKAILNSTGNFDIVVRGEGERTFGEILKAIDQQETFSHISGLTYKNDGQIIENPERDQIANLDDLPIPAYHLIDVSTYVNHPDFRKFHVEAGRGCPFICTFCSTSLVWKRKYRVKSVDRLLKEVSFIQTHFGWKKFDFVHDNLVFKKEYIHSLCDAIENQKLNIQWSCTSRSDHIAKETIQTMAQAGCSSIFFGIESGNWERQKQIKKRIKSEQTLDTIQYCAQAGLGCTASLILGYPSESKEELNETLQFAHLLKLKGATVVQAPVLHPHTGTDLYKQLHSQLRFSSLVNREHALSESLIPNEDAVQNNPDLYTFSLSFRSPNEDLYYYHLRSVFVVLMECYPFTVSLLLREKEKSLLAILEELVTEEKIKTDLIALTNLNRREKIIQYFIDKIQHESLLVKNIFKYEDAWRKIKAVPEGEPAVENDLFIYVSQRSMVEHFDFDVSSLIEYAENSTTPYPIERSNYILFKAQGEEGVAGEIDETTVQICAWVNSHKNGAVLWTELDSLRSSLKKEKTEVDQCIQSLCDEGILFYQQPKTKEVAYV